MKVSSRRLFQVVAAAALVMGCTGSRALRDPELRRRAAGIRIVEPAALEGRKYTLLGEVSAATCTSGIHRTNYSPEALQEMLKGEAAQLQADAVANVACGEGGVRFECWTSYECRGDALRYDSAPPSGDSSSL